MSQWYGFEDRDRVVRQALFVCPRCGLDRDGDEVQPRRWFTLVGIPILPLQAGEHLLRCGVCDHRCDLGVLEIPTTEVLASYLADAMRHAVTAVVRAGVGVGGDIHPDVRRAAVAAIRVDGFRYDDDRLDDDLAGLDDVGTALTLGRLATEMTTHGKQAFLHRMSSIATAGEPMTERERQALVDLGISLRMPAQDINDVITVAGLVGHAA